MNGFGFELDQSELLSIIDMVAFEYTRVAPIAGLPVSFVPIHLDSVAQILARHSEYAERLIGSDRRFEGKWIDSLILQILMYYSSPSSSVIGYITSVLQNDSVALLAKSIASLMNFSKDHQLAGFAAEMLNRLVITSHPALSLWIKACRVHFGCDSSPPIQADDLGRMQTQLAQYLSTLTYEEQVIYSYVLRRMGASIDLVFPSFFLLLELHADKEPLELIDSLCYVATPQLALRPHLPDVVECFSNPFYPLLVAASRQEYCAGLEDELAAFASAKLPVDQQSIIMQMLYREW